MKYLSLTFTREKKVLFHIIVYPEENKAKAYKIANEKYSKQGGFFTETYHLDGTSCNAVIDFNAVFKQFRK